MEKQSMKGHDVPTKTFTKSWAKWHSIQKRKPFMVFKISTSWAWKSIASHDHPKYRLPFFSTFLLSSLAVNFHSAQITSHIIQSTDWGFASFYFSFDVCEGLFPCLYLSLLDDAISQTNLILSLWLVYCSNIQLKYFTVIPHTSTFNLFR